MKTPKALARIRKLITAGKLDKLTRTEFHQMQFIDLVRSMGGFATWVDSVESARAALGRARRGETG